MKVDVAIVGASVSGSFLAYLLGDRGVKVALIDKLDFPRRKACGEGLAAVGVKYLERAGLWSASLANASSPFYGYDLVDVNGRRTVLSSESRVRPEGYAISRRELDQVLHASAVRLPTVHDVRAAVSAVEWLGDAVHLRLRDGDIEAKIVVFAHGSPEKRIPISESALSSDVRGSLESGLCLSMRSSSSRYGIVFWVNGRWRCDVPQNVIIRKFVDYQVLLTPLAGGQLNISVMIGRDLAMTKADLRVSALTVAEEFGFEVTEVVEHAGVAELTSRRRLFSNAERRFFYIGDAAERFDPIGGMGMTHSFLSASIAGNYILRTLRRGTGRQGVSYYNLHRSLYAIPLRLLTRLSFDLNVMRYGWVGVVVDALPSFAFGVQALIKRLIPVAGLVKTSTGREQNLVSAWKGA